MINAHISLSKMSTVVSTPKASRLLTALLLALSLTSSHCQTNTSSAASNGSSPTTSAGTGGITYDVVTTGTPTGECWLSAPPEFRDDLSLLLNDRGAKLVEFTVQLPGHPEDLLDERMKHIFRPHHWVRSTSRQGRSLLMLDDTYGPMSLSTLAIGVEESVVNLTDNPVRCLRTRSEEDTLRIIRESFLRDFADPSLSQTGSLSADEHICARHILDDDGYARFVYRCCRFDANNRIECEDVEEDHYIIILLTLITIIKVLVVLYSPAFIPETLYRLKYVACQYLYHPPKPLKLKVVVTQEPDQFGPNARDKCVRLQDLKNMEVFKTMVSNSRWMPEKVYEVIVKDVRLSVKARRLLRRATTPVTMKSIIYNNLIRCRIRKLDALQECCDSNILGQFNPGIKMIKWHDCMKTFASICLMFLFATPWLIRIHGYFSFEKDTINEKREAAGNIGLDVKYPGSIVVYLSPVHALFVLIYLIFLIDSLVYGVISKAYKEKFKHVVRQCLRDMRERSRIAIISWMTKMIVLPFTMFGVLGFLLFPFYLILLVLFGVPVAAFYIFPTLNLSVRLIINLFIFMCPNRVLSRMKQWIQKFQTIRDKLQMNEVTANENFAQRHHYSRRGIALQLVVILMVLISFWSLTLMLMEIASFFVELLVYTFMGVIVNAGTILQYVTVLFLLFLYSKNCFATVTRVYQAYHEVIHSQLLKMKKAEIDEVAKQDASLQQNAAFIVQGEQASNMRKDVTPRIKIKEQQPQWSTHGMLLFLDKYDTPFTPEKFFFETIDLGYFGCPGPIYRNVLSAFWEFFKILMFLAFILLVVMAFGDAYQVSTTNQLLATVVGGFVPFLFRYIFVADSGVGSIDTSSVQFTTEFHKTINNYSQSWGVFDIIPISYKEWDGSDDVEEGEDMVDNIDDRSEMDGNGNNNKPGDVTDANNSGVGSGGGDPNLSTTPLLDSPGAVRDTEIHLGEEAATSSGGWRFGGTSVGETTTVDFGYPEVDIIVDVSSARTRRANALVPKGFEKGSVSMLDRSGSARESARESDRIYRPNERPVDV